jgi:hypothetical protein
MKIYDFAGRTPLARAHTRELERICEIGVLNNLAGVFQNTNPMFASRIKQPPEAAERESLVACIHHMGSGSSDGSCYRMQGKADAC